MRTDKIKDIEVNSRLMLKRLGEYMDQCIARGVHQDFWRTEDFVRDCLETYLRDEWDDSDERGVK